MIKKFLLITLFCLLPLTAFAEGNDEFTVYLLHMNGDDESQTITDDAFAGTHTWTARNEFQIDTAQSVFGGASALGDGTGDYADTADSADDYFGTGNFTIDLRVRFSDTTGEQTFFAKSSAGADFWAVRKDNTTNK